MKRFICGSNDTNDTHDRRDHVDVYDDHEALAEQIHGEVWQYLVDSVFHEALVTIERHGKQRASRWWEILIGHVDRQGLYDPTYRAAS